MPEWLARPGTIPNPFAKKGKDGAFDAVMLDLPMSDLFMNGREFLSSFLPMVRPFIESYVIDQSTFSGAPIEGKPVAAPLSGVLKPLAGILEAVGITKTGADGRPYIDDKLQNILGIIPVFSRMRNWIYEDPERAKLRANTVFSAGFGLGLRRVDEETLVDNELDFYYSQVLPMVEHLKDMGYTLPTTEDLQSAGQMTDTILTSLGIEPNVALAA